MASTQLRPVWGKPGVYFPSDGMVQVPGGSGLYDASSFTETPVGSGLFAFTEVPATAATLTQHMDGNPWVEVFFPQLDPATASVTIYRFSDKRTWEVRGGINIAPGVPAQDFEVPFNVEATYRAQMFADDGTNLGFTNPVSTTVVVPRGFATVHQVLDPSLWAKVHVMKGSADTIVRPTPGDRVMVDGGTVPKWIGSRRQGVASLPLTLYTDTIAAADAFQSMLGDYETEQVAVLCIRTAPPIRIPRTLFIASDEIVEKELDLAVGGQDILYEFDSADEVEPPYPGLVMPLLTYDDIDASYPTYDVQDATYPTYTDRDRAYELAGASG